MFNLGFSEMILLGVIALIVIGPKKLPEVARVIARMMNEFKRATSELTKPLNDFKNEAQNMANAARKAVIESEEALNLSQMDIKNDLEKAINSHSQKAVDHQELIVKSDMEDVMEPELPEDGTLHSQDGTTVTMIELNPAPHEPTEEEIAKLSPEGTVEKKESRNE
jgi:Tat protein translocase TatB subunit